MNIRLVGTKNNKENKDHQAISIACICGCSDLESKCTLNHCPYLAISSYQDEIPLPDDKDLHFLRAIHPQTKNFTKSNWGVNEVGKTNAFLNSLLPKEMQVENPTAHSTRRTGATIAINAGQDPLTVALQTQHRSLDSLKRYVNPSDNLRAKTSETISATVSSIESRLSLEWTIFLLFLPFRTHSFFFEFFRSQNSNCYCCG